MVPAGNAGREMSLTTPTMAGRQGQCSDHGTRPAQAGRLAVELRAVGGFGGADHVGCKHYRTDQQDTGQRRGPLVGQDESRMQRFRSPASVAVTTPMGCSNPAATPTAS